MSATEEASLNLVNLSSDIIRIITRNAGLLSIDNVRLISPRWNAMVLEHLNDDKCRPVIRSIRWNVALFRTTITHETPFQEESFSLFLSSENVLNYLARLFRRCLRIDRLKISSKDFNELAIKRNAMRNLPIYQLTVRGDGTENVVMQFLEIGGQVQRLIVSFEVQDRSPENAAGDLLNFADRFRGALQFVDEVQCVAKRSEKHACWSSLPDCITTNRRKARLVTEPRTDGLFNFSLIMNKRHQ